MRGRVARGVALAGCLLAVPAACSTDPPRNPGGFGAMGGAPSGGTGSGGSLSSDGSLLGSIEPIDSGSGGGANWVPPECPAGLDSPFDVCVHVPCPRGVDCSNDGTAGASNGGAAGAAGASSTSDEGRPLTLDLCPVQFPPLNPVVGCSPWQYCMDPPVVADGGLTCCYRVPLYHCR